MKKITLLFGLGCVLLFGCQKEEQSALRTLDVPELDNTSIYLFNPGDGISTWEVVSLLEIPGDLPPSEISNKKYNSNQGNSSHAHGKYSGYGGAPATIKFQGTYNNGGTHGNGTFIQNLTLPFPPFNAVAHVKMETECLTVDGDEAVYGGVFTEVIDNGGFPPGVGPFSLGNVLYFKVKDNGQGNNAAPDQYSPSLLISPGTVMCGDSITMPGHPFWAPVVDVDNASDKIKIN